jgi:hypothetical protein
MLRILLVALFTIWIVEARAAQPVPLADETALRSIIAKYAMRVANGPGVTPPEVWWRYVDDEMSDILTERARNLLKAFKTYRRTLSSPWPGEIQVLGVKRLDGVTYKVAARHYETTNVSSGKTQDIAYYPTDFVLKNVGGTYRIDDIVQGERVEVVQDDPRTLAEFEIVRLPPSGTQTGSSAESVGRFRLR